MIGIKNRRRIVALLFLGLIVFGGIKLFNNSTEKTIEEVRTIEVRDFNIRNYYEEIDGKIIKVNKDSVKCMNINGEDIWQEAINVDNPVIKRNNNTIAISENRGHDVYVFNQHGIVSKLKTEKPIVKFNINKNGYVAILEEETDSYVLKVYTDKGEKNLEIKNYLIKDGYVMDFDITDDNEMLIIGSVDVSLVTPESKVDLYRLSKTEGNENPLYYSKKLESIIGKIEVLKDDEFIIVTNDSILKFDGYNEKWVEEIIGTIKKIFIGNSNMYLVFGKEYGASLDELLVIDIKNGNTKDNNLGTIQAISYFNGDEDEVFIKSIDSLKSVVVSDINWEKNFQDEIELIRKINSKEYLVVTQNNVKIMKITRKEE
ncbi:MAG: DUF5711 family protein [Clostridia bacterium]|nr:DUF5711 family protein [Clostridia bacterium]